MIKGIYKTASSMIPRLRKQEVIADNMANVQTPGFKKESVFMRTVNKEQQSLRSLSPSWEVKMLDKVYTDFSQGPLEYTGRDLDVAIEGEGFFVVQNEDGEAYTRNGSFTLAPDGTLVTPDGKPVLTDSGPIVIDGNQITIHITGDIEVNGQLLGKLAIVKFENPNELKRIGSSLYQAPSNLEQLEVENTSFRQGYVENSNVDVIKEMVEMISSYRSFEMGQKLIQIQDESLSKAVNDLGRVR